MNTLERIQVLANEKGLTIAELERLASLGNGTIRRWKNSLPAADKLHRVAEILGVSVDYLITGQSTVESEKINLIAREVSNLSEEQKNAILNMIKSMK